jgi:hypothetical protein
LGSSDGSSDGQAVALTARHFGLWPADQHNSVPRLRDGYFLPAGRCYDIGAAKWIDRSRTGWASHYVAHARAWIPPFRVNWRMVRGWQPEHSIAVARCLSRLRSDSSPHDHVREVAERTGCLPIYSGWVSTLLLSPAGELLSFDLESGRVSGLKDTTWESVALACMARDFPELSSLLPTRPANATDCLACRGIGFVLSRAVCGECSGMGWKSQPVH